MDSYRRKKHSGTERRLTEQQKVDLESLAELPPEVDLAKLLEDQAAAESSDAVCERLAKEAAAQELAIWQTLDPPIDQLLREARAADPRTSYELAKLMGVETDILYRFESGKDIRLATAAKLAEVLNLTLTPKAQPKRPRLKRGRKMDQA